MSAIARAGGITHEVTASVIEDSTENAFALPGGRVYILSGLLRRANDPDELAGVVAHELGHVAHRDQIRALLHDGGVSFLVGLLFGDVTGSSTILLGARTMFEASY